MHHLHSPILATVLACAAIGGLYAGDAPPSPPTVVASAACPDLARTRARYAESLWGRIWALPALASARAATDKQMATLAQEIGIDPNLLIADVASAEGAVTVAALGAQPAPAARLHFPATIATVMKVLAARPGSVIAADGQVTLGEAAFHRDGEWLVVAPAGAAAAAPPRVQPLEPDSDLTGQVDLLAMARLGTVDAERKDDMGRMFALLGLSTLRAHIAFVPEGTREVFEWPGLRLPLAPLDPAALAALPEQPLILEALGLDGARLAATVRDVLKASDDPNALAEVDRNLAALNLPDLMTILGGLHGTAWMAAVNGAPFPSFTVAIPATPEIDACVQALAAAKGVDLGAARSEAVPLPLPPGVPVLVAVRRTATHWVVGSDAELLERLGTGQAGGYALPAAAPGALPTLGLFTVDERGLGQIMLSYMPLMMKGMMGALPPDELREQRKTFVAFQQGLAAALPLLTPSVAFVTQPPLGTTITARNTYFIAPLLAGMMLPAIGQVRQMANQQKSGKNLSQLCGALIAYETSEDKVSTTLAELVANQKLPAKLLTSPSAPSIANPYLYIRSVAEPDAAVPLFIEDPACNKGKGCMVCFGDSHTKFIKAPAAQRLWAEAQRLAASPKAAAGGIATEDWAAVNDVLGLGPAEPAADAPGPEAIPTPPGAAPIP